MSDKLRIFISYSRQNTSFVDRLEADLRARDFEPWVDRQRLEGGDEWMNEIQTAVESCQVLLLIVSPSAIESKYVRMEYRHAMRTNKRVIPLLVEPTPAVPMDLNDLQWIDIQPSYDEGLRSLLNALSRIMPAKPLPARRPEPVPELPDELDLELDLVAAHPAPPEPDPDLNGLFMSGVEARAKGDLDRAALLWQQVVDRDPDFRGGFAMQQLNQISAELHPFRMRRLRQQAEQARQRGEWSQEISAWEALLALKPDDEQAQVAQAAIERANHHQKYAWLYENAKQLIQQRKHDAAREHLAMLKQEAPEYGDPAGLLPRIQMHDEGRRIVLMDMEYQDAKYLIAQGQYDAAREKLSKLEQEADFVDPAGLLSRLRANGPAPKSNAKDAPRQQPKAISRTNPTLMKAYMMLLIIGLGFFFAVAVSPLTLKPAEFDTSVDYFAVSEAANKHYGQGIDHTESSLPLNQAIGVGITLALGMALVLYRWVYHHVIPLSAVIVPAIASVFLLFLAWNWYSKQEDAIIDVDFDNDYFDSPEEVKPRNYHNILFIDVEAEHFTSSLYQRTLVHQYSYPAFLTFLSAIVSGMAAWYWRRRTKRRPVIQALGSALVALVGAVLFIQVNYDVPSLHVFQGLIAGILATCFIVFGLAGTRRLARDVKFNGAEQAQTSAADTISVA